MRSTLPQVCLTKVETNDDACTLTTQSMYFKTRKLAMQLNGTFQSLFFSPFFRNHYSQHDHLIYYKHLWPSVAPRIWHVQIWLSSGHLYFLLSHFINTDEISLKVLTSSLYFSKIPFYELDQCSLLHLSPSKTILQKKKVGPFKFMSFFVPGKWKTRYRGRPTCLSQFYHLSPFSSKLSNPTLKWQTTFILYPQLPLKVRNNSQKALTKPICYFPLNLSPVKTHAKFSRLLTYSDQ